MTAFPTVQASGPLAGTTPLVPGGATGTPQPAVGRSSTFGNPYTFTARRLDSTTGLLYYRHRYYEASAGRFLSRDTARSLSRYTLGDNATPTWLDPLGLQATKPTFDFQGWETCYKTCEEGEARQIRGGASPDQAAMPSCRRQCDVTYGRPPNMTYGFEYNAVYVCKGPTQQCTLKALDCSHWWFYIPGVLERGIGALPGGACAGKVCGAVGWINETGRHKKPGSECRRLPRINISCVARALIAGFLKNLGVWAFNTCQASVSRLVNKCNVTAHQKYSDCVRAAVARIAAAVPGTPAVRDGNEALRQCEVDLSVRLSRPLAGF